MLVDGRIIVADQSQETHERCADQILTGCAFRQLFGDDSHFARAAAFEQLFFSGVQPAEVGQGAAFGTGRERSGRASELGCLRFCHDGGFLLRLDGASESTFRVPFRALLGFRLEHGTRSLHTKHESPYTGPY